MAVLPAGIAVMRADNRGVRTRWLDRPASYVITAGARLSALCATPHASEAEIQTAGRELFDLLLKPEVPALTGRRLALDVDPELAAIPFEAFTRENGEYLGLSFVISYSAAGHPPASAPISRASRALIVSAPAGEAPGGTPLVVLPDAEAEVADIARRFTGADVLRGPDAGPG